MSRLLRTRWFVRAPIRFYRAGLGWLLGEDMLLLEHRGRTSGELRSAVLEVTGREGHDRYVVVSGLGPRSQWLRNVAADPRVLVSVGRRSHVPAVAVRLDPDGAAAHLERYAQEHPRRWRTFEPVMAPWARPLADADGEADWRRVVPVIELRLEPAAD
ncbi:nitroreductase family deazaflavin-dependent oxidoreductase [Isoptericola jiangsuensis]|nr:nitroreductase family deazaflavin-dependent oxidoreductase [Isoptericola jiangsuensis]